MNRIPVVAGKFYPEKKENILNYIKNSYENIDKFDCFGCVVDPVDPLCHCVGCCDNVFHFDLLKLAAALLPQLLPYGEKLLKRRLEITRDEIAAMNEIQAALEADFESARRRYEQELASLAPSVTPGRREDTVRLPYREYRLSTGLKLLVGRQGADNDRTTFDHARPYELWFHTQQCPGSHVVIKFPNKSFVPSKAEIEEAAAVAAFHSKARHDSLVPVIYTERRHVRKPRKAKPGLVTVQREKSLMVAPRPPSK